MKILCNDHGQQPYNQKQHDQFRFHFNIIQSGHCLLLYQRCGGDIKDHDSIKQNIGFGIPLHVKQGSLSNAVSWTLWMNYVNKLIV